MHLTQSIQAYLNKQKTRRELADLPAYLYQDVGLSQEQVEAELCKSCALTTAKQLAKKIFKVIGGIKIFMTFKTVKINQ